MLCMPHTLQLIRTVSDAFDAFFTHFSTPTQSGSKVNEMYMSYNSKFSSGDKNINAMKLDIISQSITAFDS